MYMHIYVSFIDCSKVFNNVRHEQLMQLTNNHQPLLSPKATVQTVGRSTEELEHVTK